MKSIQLSNIQSLFFIGVAGAGMSAIAQYLAGAGKEISGSDREFSLEKANKTQTQLVAEGIKCFPQDGSGISEKLDAVIVSTAIEPTVYEYKKALELGIPVYKRSEILATIAQSKKTIGVSGTSGKSTVTAMIFHILNEAGLSPSLITGAGLSVLEAQGKIGNAVFGKGEYLVIEVDESDGSIVEYTPHIGLILNIEKDHKSIDELETLFEIYKSHTKHKLIVNQNNRRAAAFSQNLNFDFGFTGNEGFSGSNFSQSGFQIDFNINDIPFTIKQIGKHNAENALAATAAASACGISIEKSAEAMRTYQGIARRNSFLGQAGGITVIDDYAHNPAKISAAIKSCQAQNGKLFIWFQPHGFGPTKFLRHDFVQEISQALRPEDTVIMSDIYYAGGTADKSISSGDLISDIQKTGRQALYLPNRNDLLQFVLPKSASGDIILLTGARDPSLGEFARRFFENLQADV